MALKWLSGSVTQGVADAFAETEFQTGLSNVTRTAFRIRRIEWALPALIGADSNFRIALRRSSVSALTSTSLLSPANSVIAAVARVVELTTSGMYQIETCPVGVNYARDMDLLIVEESLFLSIDSDGSGVANIGQVRIGYEQRTITENERLQILSATASG